MRGTVIQRKQAEGEKAPPPLLAMGSILGPSPAKRDYFILKLL